MRMCSTLEMESELPSMSLISQSGISPSNQSLQTTPIPQMLQGSTPSELIREQVSKLTFAVQPFFRYGPRYLSQGMSRSWWWVTAALRLLLWESGSLFEKCGINNHARTKAPLPLDPGFKFMLIPGCLWEAFSVEDMYLVSYV